MNTQFHLPLTRLTGSAVARRLVEHALTSWSLGHRLDDALIVTTELVENALEHTKAAGELCLTRLPGRVRIEVTDSSSELPVVHELNLASRRGRGLWMVQAIAAAWGAESISDGKTVWAELDTAGDGRRAAR